VRGVKLSSEFKIDLDPMLQASKGAGLVFYCNPNNPTRALRRRQGDARLPREDDLGIAGHDESSSTRPTSTT